MFDLNKNYYINILYFTIPILNSQGQKNYLFRLDEYRVIDATTEESVAKLINHSCNRNCKSQIVEEEEGNSRVVIFSIRQIKSGEELSYDDEISKEKRLCKSKNCKKWLY